MLDFDINKIAETINVITITVYKTGIDVYFAICDPAQWIRLFDNIFDE